MSYEPHRSCFAVDAVHFVHRILRTDDINLEKIAKDHELAGGAIMNAIRYASLQALARDSDTIVLDELMQSIRKEYAKTGKSS